MNPLFSFQVPRLASVLFAVVLVAFLPLSHAETGSPAEVPLQVKDPGARREGWGFRSVGDLPIHVAGRVKPFDTYAREVSLYLTGSRRFDGWDPSEFLLSVITAPQAWDDREFLQVGREDVRKQIGIDGAKTRFSPRQLIRESHLAQYAETISRGENALAKPPIVGGAPKQDPRDKELKTVLDRLGTYRAMVTGQGWPVIPRPAPEAWATLADGVLTAADEPLARRYADLIRAYATQDKTAFDAAAVELHSQLRATIPGWTSADDRRLTVESIYNRSRPFMVSWVLYLGAALLGALAAASVPRLTVPAVGLALAGLVVHTAGMGMRIWIAGRPPVSNMYESVIWVSFGTLLFAFVIWLRQRQLILITVASALSALMLIVADSAPAVMDPSIHPLVPVLRSNLWLTVHVLTITLGYAAFALTLGLGNVVLFHFLRGGPGNAARVTNLNQLTYRAMQFGVVLLAAGTLLGGVWADYSWGRFWGWDPKEVWALIALMGYLIILHARYTGWVGQFGFAAWTVVGFSLVVMAWYGVNFVLGVGLHSYGFSTGGRGVVATFLLAQFAFVAAAALLRERRRGVAEVSSG